MARKDKEDSGPEYIDTGDNSSRMVSLESAVAQEAGEEAHRISSEARKEAERKNLYAEKQAESILKEARENAEAQAEKIRQQVLSGVAIEKKRRTMKIQEDVHREILQRAVSRIQTMVDTDEYRPILLAHIVEAGIGLDVPAARINASERERSMISGDLMREAEKRVKTLTGRSTRLTISEEPPLKKLGVVLTSEDNRTSYNNQIDTRLMRKSTKIRQFIYERLFGE